METVRKKLTKVGNSKGIIFSAGIIQEYGLETEVIIEKREEGILIKPYKPSFQSKLDALRKNKDKIYKTMEKQAHNKDIQAYYAHPENTIADINNDIID
jgi:hypothetical protein